MGKRDVDHLLATAIARGATREEAARTAGVSVRTLHRRLEDAQFQSRVDDLRDELAAEVTARLLSACTQALVTLEALLGPAEPPAVRLGAARILLDQAQRWRVAEDVEVRLAALESASSVRRQSA
jgi:hypothetical protein